MPDISLTSFVDFVAVAGRRRVALVRECKLNSNQPYDPRKDFYKRLRENICAFEKGAFPRDAFLEVNDWNIADKKTMNFQEAVDCYLGWRDNFQGSWSESNTGFRTFGELRIRVNPEVGLTSGGNRHSIKLHFKKEAVPANRMTIIHELMLGVNGPLQTAHLLDIRRQELFSQSAPDPDVGILLAAEASAFMAIWNAV